MALTFSYGHFFSTNLGDAVRRYSDFMALISQFKEQGQFITAIIPYMMTSKSANAKVV